MVKKFEPYAHQRKFADLWFSVKRALNFDGCGTGKTLSCIHAVKTYWPGARVCVIAPLTILEVAWGHDLKFGWAETTYGIASGTAAKKRKVFESDRQWVITNHDSIKMMIEEGYEKQFDIMIVDEGDAFRNRTSQRSKAMMIASQNIPIFTLMTGTPTPNSITDIWHLAMLVDGGERLGSNFWGFRQQVCDAKPVYGAPPGAMTYTDKPGANDHVTLMLSDISSRVTLDSVAELPETITRDITIKLPPKLRGQYEYLLKESIMLLENGEIINALHAGARTQKLLQTVSGAIYDEFGEARGIHTDRDRLVLDLVQETDACLVAFNWTHQRDGLVAEARRRKLSYAVIDGSVAASKRADIVERFQRGELAVLFAHPQSAGHGITLTRANRIIWASPTYRADLYEQFNHRPIRLGQTRKTEIIHIAAENTVEEQVYTKLISKQISMLDLLHTLKKLASAA